MNERRVQTTKIGGGADYAKVADRLKEFRTQFPNSKIEISEAIKDDDLVVFKAWVWKDKGELIELAKAGVTDKDTLRSTSDADGAARSRVGVKEKDYEKLQSIAVGRALAMLGFLASGEIASFEEMEEFVSYKQQQRAEYVEGELEKFKHAKTMDELKRFWIDTDKTVPEIVAAKDKRKSELEATSKKKEKVVKDADQQ